MAKPQQVKLKKSAWIGIIVTCLALILFVILLIPTEKEKIYKTFSETNQEFKEDHIIDKISVNKFKNLLEKSKEERVYVLYSTVDTCSSQINIINDLAQERGIDKIYWLDAADKKIDEDEEKEEFSAYLKGKIGKDQNGIDLIKRSYLRKTDIGTTLDMFVFQNGTIVDRYYDVNIKLTSGETSKSTEYILKNYMYVK